MRVLPSAAVLFCLLVPAASAADPIMPLDQVQRGMHCEGRSVFRGTDVETFDVEILDVISGGASGGAQILFRASGPRVAETGIGPGFSGSPIYCPDSEGTLRNAGAVAAGIEDYGNDVALATPIEDILGTPHPPPSQARPATAAERAARPWSLPLTLSGTGAIVRRALLPVARRNGLDLIAAPATAAQVPPGADLVPGSATGASISNGRIGLSAIGTIAYRDGDTVWAFGHPLDNAGRRSLFLENAFVHAVIGNPNPSSGDNLGTYKLASPGTVVGGIGFDGPFAITGTVGLLPRAITVEVAAQRGGEALPLSETSVADESALNYPSGLAPLSFVAPIAVADSAFGALGSGSSRSYGILCMRALLADRDRPIGFCNRYVGDGRGTGGPQIAMAGDTYIATTLLDEYDRSQLHIDRVEVALALDEGLRFAVMRSASAPRVVRRGQIVRVRLLVQPPRGTVRRVSFRMRIPRSLKPGRHTLRLTGTEADPGEGSLEGTLGFAVGAHPGAPRKLFQRAGEPDELDDLAASVASIERFDGVWATFKKRRSGESDELSEILGLVDPSGSLGRPVYRHPTLRIGGQANVRLRVRR